MGERGINDMVWMIFLIIAAICCLIATIVDACLCDFDNKLSAILSVCSIIVIILAVIELRSYGLFTLYDHIDQDETHITKVDGKVTEIDLVIDGKHYDIVFDKGE